MGGIGLITTSEDIKFRYVPDFIYHRIPQKILNTMCFTFKSIAYEKFSIPDTDVCINIARLPFMEKQLDALLPGDLQNFCNIIIDDFRKEGIDSIFLCEPLELYRKLVGNSFERIQQCKNRDKKLLISLCIDISKKICKILGINLFEIHVKIIEDSYSCKSKLLINMLSSYTKYISLVTQDIKSAQADMDEIYDETGLTVRVSREYSRTTETEIVYMLEDINKCMTKNIFGQDTILFLLNSQQIIDNHMSSIIIDSVDIKVPLKIDTIIKPLKLTNVEDFMESVLSIEVGSKINDKSNSYYEEMRNIFNQLGCQVNALKACNTLVNMGRFDRIAKKFKAVK